ncbi:MAG: NAD-dependent epimerase/dehydratase family protein [Acidobacteria bacterium]|nr:NAD-dependent epimerase/dehydratase family protein [Acidobacteriota bacterium]
MKVLVTGGAGFLGDLLVRRLLASPLELDGRPAEEIHEVVVADLVAPRDDVVRDRRVRALAGELADTVAAAGDVDAVFHLAGVVSGAAEADFDLGMRTNLDGTRRVLEAARAQAEPPVLVFTSSLAVFGADPAIGPVGVVTDDTLPRPQSSYGVQKFIGEQLVADFTRKGFVRGRSVRLMTVSVRPGAPNAAASSFLSGIIREPIAGTRAECPVAPDTPVAVSSPRRTVDGIVAAASVSTTRWGSRTAMNLPALTTTPRAMAFALDRVTGEPLSDLIDWTDDGAIGAIVGSWPAEFVTTRASALGLAPEASYDDIVRAYLADRQTPAPH